MKTANIFTDHMVLQREKPIKIWGQAKPGEEIAVSLAGAEAFTKADASGSWQITLAPMEAAVGLTLTVSGEGEIITCTDVAIGEVWLAGGQSNMEYQMGWEAHYEEELKGDLPSRIRFFTAPQIAYPDQLTEYGYANDGFWRPLDQECFGRMTAVGYYFAKELLEDLKVPIGIVSCNWGGTTAAAWIDPECLKEGPASAWLEFDRKNYGDLTEEEALAEYRAQGKLNDRSDLLNDWFCQNCVKYTIPQKEQEKMAAADRAASQAKAAAGKKVREPYERRPGTLYRLMLSPLAPYAIRGFLWYQGESDDAIPEAYRDVMETLVKNWRSLWGEELPFYFVQLAPFGRWLGCTGKNYPILRKRQEEAADSISNCAMAANGDAGMEWDIHPKDKHPAGHRLALLARRLTYGEAEVACFAPCATEAKRDHVSGEIRIRFDHAEGLWIKGEKLNALICLDQKENPIPDEALSIRIEGEVLCIGGEGADRIAETRFAQTPYYEVNLYNKAGLPAFPFALKIRE